MSSLPALTPTIQALAKQIYDYLYLPDPGGTADVLIVLGASDLRVPQYAAQICATRPYPWVVVTGGVDHTNDVAGGPFGGREGPVFAKVMIEAGAHPAQIIVEDQALSTGDNITFSHQKLADKGVVVHTGHLLHKPPMALRSLATAQKQWPGVAWAAFGEAQTYGDYMTDVNERARIITMVGDAFRMLWYPEKGYQVPVDMPPDVRQALKALIDMGFSERIPGDYARFF